MGVALDSSGVLVLLMVVMGISASTGSWFYDDTNPQNMNLDT